MLNNTAITTITAAPSKVGVSRKFQAGAASMMMTGFEPAGGCTVRVRCMAAMAVADHAYVLETGAIALCGPAAELAADPRVIETYFGKAKT